MLRVAGGGRIDSEVFRAAAAVEAAAEVENDSAEALQQAMRQEECCATTAALWVEGRIGFYIVVWYCIVFL